MFDYSTDKKKTGMSMFNYSTDRKTENMFGYFTSKKQMSTTVVNSLYVKEYK